jgi:chromosome segregation ATPase
MSARINANTKEMNVKMDANQANADKLKEILADLSAKIAENTKELNATQERINANLENLKEYIKFSQAEMRSTVCAIRSELEETIQHKMKGVLPYVDQKTQNLRR